MSQTQYPGALDNIQGSYDRMHPSLSSVLNGIQQAIGTTSNPNFAPYPPAIPIAAQYIEPQTILTGGMFGFNWQWTIPLIGMMSGNSIVTSTNYPINHGPGKTTIATRAVWSLPEVTISNMSRGGSYYSALPVTVQWNIGVSDVTGTNIALVESKSTTVASGVTYQFVVGDILTGGPSGIQAGTDLTWTTNSGVTGFYSSSGSVFYFVGGSVSFNFDTGF